jgi:DNA-binding transcriptional MerR regulator
VEFSGDGTGLLPIRTVARLTGVKPVTLRAWERRYGLISPSRTESGHRLYSAEDVERIRRAVALVRQGVAIGRVGALLGPDNAEGVEVDGAWQRHRRSFENAVESFAEAEMDTIHRGLIMRFPGRLVLEQVISPVATRLENGDGDASLARQRFLESWLHTKLGAHCHHSRPEDAQGNVLIAPLPGETRQLSVLAFALLASEAGFRPTLLGADTPPGVLPLAVRRSVRLAVILYGYRPAARLFLDSTLPRLVGRLAIPCFVQGRASETARADFTSAGCTPLGQDPVRGLEMFEERSGVTEAATR